MGDASSTSRTFRASVSGEKGFCKYAIPAPGFRVEPRRHRYSLTCTEPCGGSKLAELLGQLAPAHLRHYDVGKQQMNRCLSAQCDVERVLPTRSFDHRVAIALEDLPCGNAHRRGVLGKQNCLRSDRQLHQLALPIVRFRRPVDERR